MAGTPPERAAFSALLRQGLSARCPACGEGPLFKSGISLTFRDSCPACGLDYKRIDSADGPAVFLTFVLGFLLVPLALGVEVLFSPPLWVHVLVFGAAALILTLASLRPLKAFTAALQYRMRPGDWEG